MPQNFSTPHQSRLHFASATLNEVAAGRDIQSLVCILSTNAKGECSANTNPLTAGNGAGATDIS
ncbi:hypothetical protein LU604_09565 [Erwinia tracheiphila]|uniref:hypothetical protein n=1 Tax=Erwinia tracheiphila TaxID=65700 RepID=UPI001F3ABDBA|nr:hypothetical protein [Erwinia tracheiphila]UIA85074.1 hypothetical protein LU604_09565 [Erwinia tracheiphila]UIA93673.1 hypothetical protein LU632_09520 [Erwinia tracheiphila]